MTDPEFEDVCKIMTPRNAVKVVVVVAIICIVLSFFH